MRKYVIEIGHQRKQFFTNVLADEDNRFAASLERLALKKVANNEVFGHIKTIFDRERSKKDFKDKTKKETFAIRMKVCKITRLLIHQLIN